MIQHRNCSFDAINGVAENYGAAGEADDDVVEVKVLFIERAENP